MKEEDFYAPPHIDLYQTHLDLRNESNAYKKMIDMSEGSNLAEGQVCGLYISKNTIMIALNQSIKYIYYWITMMKSITNMEKDVFIKRYITSKFFSLQDKKNVLEAIVDLDEESIKSIHAPSKEEIMALDSIKGIFKLYDRIFIFFWCFFILYFLYSLYVLSVFFPYLLPLFVLIGAIILIYSFLKITEPAEGKYLIVGNVISVLAVSFIIYFTSLKSYLTDIDLLLFFVQVGLSFYLLHLHLKSKSKGKQMTKRLPNSLRNRGIVGTEKIDLLPQIPSSKENFVHFLSSFNTSMSDLCPNCNGSGFVEEFVLCKQCGGRGTQLVRGYKTINDDYETTSYESCSSCNGSGGKTITVSCGYCFEGRIDSQIYQTELKEFIEVLIKRINSFGDEAYKKINEINRELDHINKKILIWNSKTL